MKFLFNSQIKTTLLLFLFFLLPYKITVFAVSDNKDAHDAFIAGNAYLNSFLEGKSTSRDVLKKAIEKYNIAIRISENFYEAFFNKGICLIYLGKENSRSVKRAEETFDKVLEIKPDFSDALFSKGQAQFRISTWDLMPGSDEWNRTVKPAITTLQETIRLFSDSEAAKKARNELKEIEYRRNTNLVQRIRNEKRHKIPPIQNPIVLSVTSTMQEKIKESISKIPKKVIEDDVLRDIHPGGSILSEKNKITNEYGLEMFHYSFMINFEPEGTYSESGAFFRTIYCEWNYGGERHKKRFHLPKAYQLATGKEATLIDEEHLEVAFIVISYEPHSKSGYYESMTLRLITSQK